MKSSSKDQKELLSVGYIKAAHGIRGEVLAQIPSGEWDWASVGKEAYLRPRHSLEDPQVFTIEKFRAHKSGLIIKFKQVLDRNQAEDLQGFTLLIEKDYFISEPGEQIFLQEVLGFKVFDKDLEIGQVIGFMYNGAQDLLRVKDENSNNKEHLVPFLEVFIESIDFENQKLLMRLPEGLIE